jgi:hypothetical protein
MNEIWRKEMKKTLFFVGFGVLMAIFFNAGCSKDSTNPNTGDENDPSFLLAKADIDSSLIEYNDDDLDGSAWLGGIPLALDDSVIFDTSSYWHIYSGTYQGEFQSWARIDSFRFSDSAGEYQQARNLFTDVLEHKLHRTYVFNNTQSGVNWQKARHRDVKWDGFTDSLLVFTGTAQRTYAGQNLNAVFSHSMSGTHDSVRFRTDDFLNGLPTHPISGQFYGTTEHSRQSNNNTIQITATFTVTFYEDHYHVHLVSGNNFWDWDHYYDE